MRDMNSTTAHTHTYERRRFSVGFEYTHAASANGRQTTARYARLTRRACLCMNQSEAGGPGMHKQHFIHHQHSCTRSEIYVHIAYINHRLTQSIIGDVLRVQTAG